MSVALKDGGQDNSKSKKSADTNSAAKSDETTLSTVSEEEFTGAEIVIKALLDQGVDVIFGYPGGAVLPIYDELFKASDDLKHILVRHEQAASHAAEGYARSTGKVGVFLVTSGPGATNAVTGLTDAMLDSIPVICISGQVPTFLIGNDAFQEADTTGITRPCTKHNYLVSSIDKLADIVHEAFHVARTGRPGPVVIDIPKDIQFAKGLYKKPEEKKYRVYQPKIQPLQDRIERAVKAISEAKRPIFYTGGGVINAGPRAAELLQEFAHETGYPVTSTLMGLGAFPASDDKFLGMLGMHGTWEANHAMHQCDVMINIGARFDDRVTGRTDAFSPNSFKIHVDIDPSSINKTIQVDLSIVADSSRKPITHCTKAAACHPAVGFVEGKELGSPHLVLPDLCCDVYIFAVFNEML
jgi:acetolactate synthase-1/2/3 large subunit